MPCCRHRGPAHRESSAAVPKQLQPKHPKRLPRSLGCTRRALQPLPRTSPLGNSGIRAGPAIPIQPGFVLPGTSQTKHAASRSPSTRATLPSTGGFGLSPHRRGRGGAQPSPWHSGVQAGLRTSGVSSAAPGSGSRPSITWQHAEPPEKPHQQVKDKPLAFSGLKLSH